MFKNKKIHKWNDLLVNIEIITISHGNYDKTSLNDSVILYQ